MRIDSYILTELIDIIHRNINHFVSVWNAFFLYYFHIFTCYYVQKLEYKRQSAVRMFTLFIHTFLLVRFFTMVFYWFSDKIKCIWMQLTCCLRSSVLFYAWRKRKKDLRRNFLVFFLHRMWVGNDRIFVFVVFCFIF